MLEILINDGRSFGGHEQLTSQKDLETWEAIGAHFSTFEVVDKKYGPLRYEVDWSPVIRYRKQERDLYAQSLHVRAQTLSVVKYKQHHKCTAIVTRLDRAQDELRSAHPLHRVLLDLYLVANISCPGSFNLYRSRIVDKAARSVRSPFHEKELEVSHYYPETAWHEANTYPWLGVGFLSFDAVLSWLQGLEISNKSMASSGIERALFSLLHIGRTRGDIDPGDIMWLASAIESLYGVQPSGGGGAILHRRIAALLGIEGQECAELNKLLRSFLELRHKFAHGGGKILHPLARDEDDGVEASISDFLRATNFAAGLLVGSIQALIRRGWPGMSFKETILPADSRTMGWA